MRTLALVALLTAAAPWAPAQTLSSNPPRFVVPRHPVAAPAPGGRLVSRPDRMPHDFSRSNAFPSVWYPFGVLSDFSYSDAPSPATAQPSVIVLQIPSANPDKDKEERQPPAEALLIELQGDRYVRVPNGPPAESARLSAPNQPAAHELAPAVLIFRDGHNEEVRDYTIVAGAIYARGDLYTDGYWTRKIELTALNLPETVKSNQARGVRFLLPNSPNEVITRP